MKLMMLVVWALCGSLVEAEEKFSAEDFKPGGDELKNVPSATLEEVVKDLPKYNGKLVKLKFNYRDKTIKPSEAAGFLSGRIMFWSSGREYKSGYLNAIFPEAGKAWFTRIETGYEGRRTVVCYARVKADPPLSTALLLGRELKIGLKGPELIW